MDTFDFAAGAALLPAAIAARGAAENDAWLHATLPPLLHARGYLTGAELSRVMAWKLKSGKWRPGLQGYVDALADADVRAASAAAFKALPAKGGAGLAAALKALCVLKGVGPATASAVLAVYQPTRCAFMSDESLLFTLGVKEYKDKAALELAEACAKQAQALGGAWTANQVQRAIWAAEVVRKQKPAPAPAPAPAASSKGKRKREADS